MGFRYRRLPSYRYGFMRVLITMGLLSSLSLSAQFRFDPELRGILAVGLRNTVSTFNGAGDPAAGLGAGGHFRLNFSSRINTEWMADYITAPIGNAGKREVYHIGWSVMYYPSWTTVHKFTPVRPFISIGHCFDYERAIQLANDSLVARRWTFAPTAGLGNHFPIRDRIDFTLAVQYMLHVGKGFEAHAEDGLLVIENHDGFTWDGHLLFTLSINYKLKKLWREKEQG
jgi:hypothetical protein